MRLAQGSAVHGGHVARVGTTSVRYCHVKIWDFANPPHSVGGDDFRRRIGPIAAAGAGERVETMTRRTNQHVEPIARVGLTRVERGLKRLFDLLVASIITVLFSPLIVMVAIAVRWTNGPGIIYSHARVGREGREFPCYKFRSMVHDADARLRELLARDPVARAEWERDHKLKDDPRVTAVGRLIRKTSLDELPQLWNVFRGDMSVVGPRPVIEAELERYGEARAHYLSVRPGLTGPWQVSGRNDIGYAERVEMDAQYVQNWNLFQDALIVFKTATVMVAKRGAY